MKAIELDVLVEEGGSVAVHVQVPGEIPPGKHRAVMVLDERLADSALSPPRGLADFPVHDLGAWPEGLSLRREDLYGDEGR